MRELQEDPVILQKVLFDHCEELSFLPFSVFFHEQQVAVEFLLDGNQETLVFVEGVDRVKAQVGKRLVEHLDVSREVWWV